MLSGMIKSRYLNGVHVKYNIKTKNYEKIKQINVKTGEIIHTFANVLDVVIELNLKRSANGKVIDCINKKQKTAYGYKWEI